MTRVGVRLGVTVAVSALGLALGLAPAASAQWKAPESAAKVANPVQGVGGAGKLIETNCAACHGSNGKGDGPAAASLPTKPADWTSEAVQKQTDGEIFWKLSNGRGPMPPWKQFSEKERWELVNYIRSLKK